MRHDNRQRGDAHLIRAGLIVLVLGSTVTALAQPLPGTVLLRDAALAQVFALRRDPPPLMARDG